MTHTVSRIEQAIGEVLIAFNDDAKDYSAAYEPLARLYVLIEEFRDEFHTERFQAFIEHARQRLTLRREREAKEMAKNVSVQPAA